LTQPIDGVGSSHHVLRELAAAGCWLSPCFRHEPPGTKGSSILVNDDHAAVNLRRLI